MSAALAIEDVAISFGGVRAVRGVSLEIATGERRVIIGPNAQIPTLVFSIGGTLALTSLESEGALG